jgi:outer membrane murein-binding lipoprotein Lpp
MKRIALLAALLLAGCASHENVSYTAPSVVAVKTGIEKLRPLVKPEGLMEINDLSKAVDTYQAQVDQQAKDLAKAQNDAAYWHQKQEKALKELWTWRLIALSAILCVVLYIGIKTSWRFLL